MNFFTPDVVFNENAAAAWDVALARYKHHWEDISDRLPSDVRAFADHEMHDASVERIEYSPAQQRCEIRTKIADIAISDVIDFSSDLDGEAEFAWLYDEWDIDNDGHITLAVLCDIGEFSVTGKRFEISIRS